jgi:Tol biopolymer transport system component
MAPGEPRYLANGRSPVFSPDGKWIVYSSRTTKGWKLYRVRPDGTGKQYIAGGSMQEVEPGVSPDGKWVLFTGYYEGKPYETQLMIRPLAGGKDHKLSFKDKPHRTTW